MNEEREIHVDVSYVGNEPWKHPFRPTDTVQTVKLEAMTKGFELEASKAEDYALQLNRADLPETKTLSEIGENPLEVELILRTEPNKG